MPREEKVAMLKESLAAIGRRIDAVLAAKKDLGEDVQRWRRHLWTYVTILAGAICSATDYDSRADLSLCSGLRR